jgi:superfamily II DNA or RNA helicase
MFHLRYYQHDARDGVRAALDRHRSTACVMPTGTGKTELYLSLAVEEPGRVLVVVHRDYLITSPVERLAKVGFADVAVEKADQRAERGGRRKKIVFASVMSIGPEARADRLRTFDPKDFSLVIIDEGHRAVSPIYRRVQGYFEAGNPRLKTLILTATPKRKDGLALGNVCESVGYEMSPAQAVEEGWIVRPRFFVREVPELDFSRVNLRGADLDQDQIADLLTQEEPLHKVCASLAEDQGPTIVFCPRVDVAHAYAALLNTRYRRGKAMAVHQNSTDADMERASKGLADGSIDFVFNVDKLTEGYDVPKVVRVAWAAPTASLVRWTQGNGRGFRPDGSIAGQLLGNREDAPARRLLIEQSAKPFCSIVTYHPSNCQHQICTAVDLLGGAALPPAVKGYAEQVQEATARQGGGSDTEHDIETAAVFVDLVSAVSERLREVKAKATVADAEYDGLGGGSRRVLRDAAGPDAAATAAAAAASWGAGEVATEKQQKWLRWKGLPADAAAGFTKWRASVVRDLYELGVPLGTAAGWPKRQALKVRDEYRSRQPAGTEDVPA